MENKDIIFLEQNIINFETTKLGFVRNLHPDLLERYANIYRKYIDPHYVITPWCSSCVMSLMQRLMNIYEKAKQEQSVNVINETLSNIQLENTVSEIKKKGRPKKQ